ncbi:hypothetical protein [Streptosporangium carneum]|uniref:Uncharacterized protein n=1 Tax=Streptosporangium carneum TaxID=47481 RepID=A0A9W6I6X9_9ACTN|nr:hypothetical protein [Streptosporangium carneum]GLK12080.1 hypothetical protein GCM10017600_54880 [Streptosporangium carneum]
MATKLFSDPIVKRAERTSLSMVERASAVPAPELRFYIEDQHDLVGQSQQDLFNAEGEAKARKPSAKAAGLATAADAQRQRLADHARIIVARQERLERAESVLSPLTTRSSHSTFKYWATIIALLFGDVAGLTGAALSSGESPYIAFMQSLAVAAATIAVGNSIGTYFKHILEARKREKARLTAQEEEFSPLFDGSHGPMTLLMIIGAIAILLIVVGIGGLRMMANNQVTGIVFGAFAGAVALGSMFNAFHHACEVSDKLDKYETAYARARREERRILRRGPIYKQAKLASISESIRTQAQLEGAGAHAWAKVGGFETLINNPGLAGHGRRYEEGSPEPVVPAPRSDQSTAPSDQRSR